VLGAVRCASACSRSNRAAEGAPTDRLRLRGRRAARPARATRAAGTAASTSRRSARGSSSPPRRPIASGEP
jgi:hypothetical protein